MAVVLHNPRVVDCMLFDINNADTYKHATQMHTHIHTYENTHTHTESYKHTCIETTGYAS